MFRPRITIKRNPAEVENDRLGKGKSNLRVLYDVAIFFPISVVVSCVILLVAVMGIPTAIRTVRDQVRAMIPGLSAEYYSNEQAIADVHFKDLPSDSKYFDAVANLKIKGIIKGYEDGTFRPNEAISRAELIAVVIKSRSLFPLQINYRNCFGDVTDQWYASAVCYAKDKKWASGFEDNLFEPESPISRAEALKIMLSAYEIKGKDSASALEFQDVSSTSWYADYINTALQRSLISENPVTELFRPNDSMTRAEAGTNDLPPDALLK